MQMEVVTHARAAAEIEKTAKQLGAALRKGDAGEVQQKGMLLTLLLLSNLGPDVERITEFATQRRAHVRFAVVAVDEDGDLIAVETTRFGIGPETMH